MNLIFATIIVETHLPPFIVECQKRWIKANSFQSFGFKIVCLEKMFNIVQEAVAKVKIFVADSHASCNDFGYVCKKVIVFHSILPLGLYKSFKSFLNDSTSSKNKCFPI